MKKIFPKTTFGVVSLALALSVARAQSAAAQSPAAESATRKAEEVYKNIQVLRGMPADQMEPTMQYFAVSLGITCRECHVGPSGARVYESDDNPKKLMARKMVQMMNAINSSTFSGAREVTCYTCHRGSAKAVGMPELPLDNPPELAPAAGAPETQSGPLPTVDQLFDKHVAALGGANAIQKVSSFVAKGTATDPRDRQFPMEILATVQDQRATVRRQPGRDTMESYSESYSGKTGWLLDGAADMRDMRNYEVDAAKIHDLIFFPGRMKQILTQLRVEGTRKVGGRDAYAVTGRSTPLLPLVTLYFDKESGMLARLQHYVESAIGRIPTQIDISEYRDVDGVKRPFRWTVTLTRGRGRFTYQVDSVQHNVPIEQANFAKPAPRAR